MSTITRGRSEITSSEEERVMANLIQGCDLEASGDGGIHLKDGLEWLRESLLEWLAPPHLLTRERLEDAVRVELQRSWHEYRHPDYGNPVYAILCPLDPDAQERLIRSVVNDLWEGRDDGRDTDVE